MNPYRNQMDQEILSAEPLELVVLLYRGLLNSIQEARLQLAKGDINARAISVSKAMVIVGELANTLDLSRGGELATGLHKLYSFLSLQLLDGNYRQVDLPLADAEAVVATLLDAWTSACSAVTLAEQSVPTAPLYAGSAPFAPAESVSICG